MGTAGARYVVARQLRASGGLLLFVNGEITLIDPGPGTLVHLSKNRINPEKIKNIIVTHKHLDHSADLNILCDALTEGGFKRRGKLFITEESLKEGILLPYLRDNLEEIHLLKEHEYYCSGALQFKTTCKLLHNAENYGFQFLLSSGKRLGLISDTAYFEELKKEFEGCDYLIINLVRFEAKEGVLHLSVQDAKRLLSYLKPEMTIITHFGMTMLRSKPSLVAKTMSEELGLKVISAFDNMRVSLI